MHASGVSEEYSLREKFSQTTFGLIGLSESTKMMKENVLEPLRARERIAENTKARLMWLMYASRWHDWRWYVLAGGMNVANCTIATAHCTSLHLKYPQIPAQYR